MAEEQLQALFEEQLQALFEMHPGLAEGLYYLRLAGVPWEDLVLGIEEILCLHRQTLN